METENRYMSRGLIKQQPYAIETTYQYRSAIFLISRCNRCAKAHATVHKLDRLFAYGVIGCLITIVLIIVASPANVKIVFSVICGFSAVILIFLSSEVPKRYFRALGTLPGSVNYVTRALMDWYPELASLIDSGYRVGKNPTDPHREKLAR